MEQQHNLDADGMKHVQYARMHLANACQEQHYVWMGHAVMIVKRQTGKIQDASDCQITSVFQARVAVAQIVLENKTAAQMARFAIQKGFAAALSIQPFAQI